LKIKFIRTDPEIESRGRPAWNPSVRPGERGAVALEYVLIAAMIALGLVAAFKAFGGDMRRAINHSWSPGSKEVRRTVDTGVGGALTELK